MQDRHDHLRPNNGPSRREFQELRRRMMARAYRVLGSPEDAEDAVQEALLKVHAAERAGVQIHDRAPFALTVTARVAIDRRRCARATREHSVATAALGGTVPSLEPGPVERAEINAELERALPMLVESLTPLERTVWVLREAFGYSYTGIAALVGKTETNCRQVGRRARTHLEEATVAGQPHRPDAAQLAREFAGACDHGDATAAVRLMGGQAALAATA
ncbi:MAG TPA: sigma-70 family RNA polymerase sigma factor [Solirubrobacteraceae bacterium]